MPETAESFPPSGDLGAALGRIPSGLFILTTRRGNQATGMLASWVQQAGFDPPMVTVALRRDRYVADWVRDSGRFVLNGIAEGDKALVRHFGRGFAPGEPAFDAVSIVRHDLDDAGPILSDALSYLIVDREGELAGGDHVVMLGRVVAGGLLRPEEAPTVHIRKSGLHY